MKDLLELKIFRQYDEFQGGESLKNVIQEMECYFKIKIKKWKNKNIGSMFVTYIKIMMIKDYLLLIYPTVVIDLLKLLKKHWKKSIIEWEQKNFF